MSDGSVSVATLPDRLKAELQPLRLPEGLDRQRVHGSEIEFSRA